MRYNKICYAIAIVLLASSFSSCKLNPTELDPEPIAVNIPDPNFETLIRDILEIPTRDITNHDLWLIKTLIGNEKNISDISGIEYCSGLTALYLKDNAITSIKPLTSLILLETINLTNNQVSDIEPLLANSGIGKGDDELILIGNPLSDESIYQHKPELQHRGVRVYSDAIPSAPGTVKIPDTNFDNLLQEIISKSANGFSTSDLATIRNLDGNNRNIENFYGIEYCTILDTLDFGDNNISDVSPLALLEHLKNVTLDNNLIEDISSLNELDSLINLTLNDNNISAIGIVRNFKHLTGLNLANNKISSAVSIRFLPKLKYLVLSDNPIINYAPIGLRNNIEFLELANMDSIDLEQLSNLTNLKLFNLSGTPITDLNPISSLINIEALFMDECGLNDITPISNLAKIEKLVLTRNRIVDITPFAELFNLRELNLGNNSISDISPLVDNWGITGEDDYVIINTNPLSDESINNYIPQLEARGVNVIY